MLIWIAVSTVVGLIAGGAAGNATFGLVVGGVLFIIGLPGIIVAWLIFGIASIGQDRADERQAMADFYADCRADEHEWNEDERMERYISASRSDKTYDNRQINIHYSGRCKKCE